MAKQKAPYNRTIELTEDDKALFSNMKLRLTRNAAADEVENKIFLGNFFDLIDFLPDGFVDLLFIDPPYNLSKKFNELQFNEMKRDEYAQYVHSWLSKLVRLLKPDASVYVCGDWKTSSLLQDALSKYFIVRNRITWEREKGRGARNNWKNNTEDIWFCTPGISYKFNIDAVKIRRKVLAPYTDSDGKPKDWQSSGGENYRETHPSNIWNDITVPFWSMPENTEHPTQKPEKLLAKIILASSNEGDMVFDPFIGSGTAAVTAKKLKRRFCGIEMDETYYMLAQKRLMMAESDNTIQGYESGIFWERNSTNLIKKKKP